MLFLTKFSLLLMIKIAIFNKYCIINQDTYFLTENKDIIFKDVGLMRNLSIKSKCLENVTVLRQFFVYENKNKYLDPYIDINHLVDLKNEIFQSKEVFFTFTKLNGIGIGASKTNKIYRSDLVFNIYQSYFNFKIEKKVIKSCDILKNLNIYSIINKYKLKLLFLNECYKSHSICPYLFKDANIESLIIKPLINTFYLKKSFSFIKQNSTNINSKISKLLINKAIKIRLNEDILNPQVFKYLTELRIIGSIDFVQYDLFIQFPYLKKIILDGQNFRQFTKLVGIRWANSINSNLKINLKNFTQYQDNLSRLVLISINIDNPDYVDYSNLNALVNIETIFPEEDFCLYIYFPFDQMVFFYIEDLKLNDLFKTCTQLWLTSQFIINSVYFSNIDFFAFLNYSKILFYYNECNFEKKILNCFNKQKNKNFKSFVSPVEISYFSFMFNILLEFFLIPAACTIGIILNGLTIFVTSKQNEKKGPLFQKQIYFIKSNGIFNIFICTIEVIRITLELSIINGTYHSLIAQYFKIVFHEFLLNFLKFNSNFSFLFFFIYRCLIINTEENRFLKFMKQIPSNRILKIGLLLGTLICMVKLLSFEINHLDLNQDFPIHISYSSKKKYNFILLVEIFTFLMHFINIIGYLVFSFLLDIILIRYLSISLKKKKIILKSQKKKEKSAKKIHLKILGMLILNVITNIIFRLPEVYTLFYLNKKIILDLFKTNYPEIYVYLYYLTRSNIFETLENIHLFLYFLSLSVSFIILYAFTTFFQNSINKFLNENLKIICLLKNKLILFGNSK